MHVMYLAPRFHTNQVDIIKGWKKRGDKVTFISYYSAPIEDHSDISPIVLGFSPLYYLIDWIYMNILKRNDPANTAFKINHGFPPIIKVGKIMKKEKPDLVILRDRTLYSMLVYLFCRMYNYQAVLYNQSPLWDFPPKTDLLHRIVHGMTPKIRITPVMGFEEEGRMISTGSYFVPFVQEPKLSPDEKIYFQNGMVEILSVGKFEPRKHHIMLLEVFDKLREVFPDIRLTIIGEATGRLQKEHYKSVTDYVEKNNLSDCVNIITNVSREEIFDFYRNSDLFVIPSTKEMASISQLEAMSFSLPVIISDKNGAVQYVENGENGYWFNDCDAESLYNKMKKMLADRPKMIEMGRNSYQILNNKYQFENYFKELMVAVKYNR